MGRKSAGTPTRFSAALNEQLKNWMERRSETLRSMEEETGISNSRLSRTIYKSEAPLNTNELEKICMALNIEIADLIQTASYQTKGDNHAQRNKTSA